MTAIKKVFTLTFTTYILLVAHIAIMFLPHISNNVQQNSLLSTPPENQMTDFVPNVEGAYEADLNWVKTTINFEQDGLATVTMLINCTPTTEHYRIYIRSLVDNEERQVIDSKTFAMSHGQKLEVNYNLSSTNDISHRIYIKNATEIYTNETLLYQLTYEADFFISNQIIHYQNDPSLIYLDLLRPIWDGDLEYQEMDLILPIDVGQSAVTTDFLDGIKFEPTQSTSDNYDISYSTKAVSSGEYWLIVTFRKDNLGVLGNFQPRLFLSKDELSLPKAFNWSVILLVSLLITLALSMFIVVINLKNKSYEEVTNFKNELYDILKNDSEEVSEETMNKEK